MSKAILLETDAVMYKLSRLFNKQCSAWLAKQEGKWPLVIKLGLPDQKAALNNRQAVGHWIKHWQQWAGAGKLEWCFRHWPALGRQQLPEKLIFSEPAEIAKWLNQSSLWQQVCERYQLLVQRWPQLAATAAKHYDTLATYNAEDFMRLQNVLDWLVTNPDSDIYLRQLPIPEIHTKWVETRKTVITNFLNAIKSADDTQKNFYALTGLKNEPQLIRMRILDANFRYQLAGLSDIYASIAEIAQLKLPVQKVYIVENLRTGLAFDDIPGALVFMGLGYGALQLSEIPWIKIARCYYWGDLDTHGFDILSQMRKRIPQLQSLLMDQETLLKAKSFWGEEKERCYIKELAYLTAPEQTVYINLRDNAWGYHIRLEQERIFWQDAWQVLVGKCLR